jgi:hypothetical protein
VRWDCPLSAKRHLKTNWNTHGYYGSRYAQLQALGVNPDSLNENSTLPFDKCIPQPLIDKKSLSPQQQINGSARAARNAFGNVDTYWRSYETNLLSGSNRNELWQRLLRIVVAFRTWCSEPAHIKRLRINQFH